MYIWHTLPYLDLSACRHCEHKWNKNIYNLDENDNHKELSINPNIESRNTIDI